MSGCNSCVFTVCVAASAMNIHFFQFDFMHCVSEEKNEGTTHRDKVPRKIEAQGMRYIIAPAGVGAGDIISSRSDAPIKPGMTKRVKYMPTGTTLHNIELMPGKGAVMCRAAGTSATLIKNGEDGLSLIALPSGVTFIFPRGVVYSN
jgi:Ribosomal Proteins L2, C-terminal domain